MPVGARAQRVGAVALALMLLAGGLVALVARPDRADSLPPGFTSTPVFTGLTLPTAMAFSPDGKVYVAEKSGVLKVFPNASSDSPRVFANLSSRVFDGYDRGLLGLTVDPRLGDGSGHDFVYVLYTKDAPPGEDTPRWRDNCGTPPGPHADGCVVSGTLSRFAVYANGSAGPEQVLIDDEWCQQFTSHSVGHLMFGPDGYLYVSGGDGASYNNADWGQFGGSLSGTPTPANPCGDPPGGEGTALSSPTARGGSMRSQSPRRPVGEARLLNGAILRVNPDTGAGVPGNPLYAAASPSSNASRILAYGLRNPFRFTNRPGTSELWLGDVGLGDWEEINRITDPTPSRAPNFGWPCLEHQTRLAGFRDLNQCDALYDDTVDPPAAAYWAYEHYVKVNADDTCGFADGSAISGLGFYTGTRYPAQYRNALFFGDNARNCLYVMTAGSNGLPDPSTTRTFIDDADNPYPADIEVDPISKDLFFVNIGLGTVNRISYASDNRAPNAVASASPTSGTAPLTVQLNGSASGDPDGDPLTYSWDTDGNGTFGDATGVRPTVTYTAGGTYQPRLMVSDPGGLTDTSTALTITVTTVTGPRNTAPPAVSGTARIGATVSSSVGTWTGTPPITYTRRWQRCTNPGPACADIVGATGPDYSPQLADEGKTLRVQVTATNAGGTSVATSATTGAVAPPLNNTPPVPRITAPLTTGKWKAGDTIRFTGSATDAQDGTVPASRLGWSVVLGHCTTTGCHEHPLASRDGVATGTIAAPDHEAPSYVEFTLTATDAFGATASVVRRVDPQTATITLASDYPGLMLAAGSGQSTPTVFTQLWVVNSQLQLNAPLTQARGQFLYTFRSWSDGGAATHTIRVPAANTTYTASYRERCTTATYPDAVGADDPLVVWRLGESGGAAAADASGHARPGTYVGGVSLGQPGALVGDVNRSVSLDGNDDRVIRNPLQGIAPGEISADLWVRTTSTTKDAGILSYATTSSADELLLRDPRALVVYVKGTRVDTGLVLNDGRWHHLAVTWRSAGGELRVYQNGTLRFSGTVRAGAALTPNGSLVLGQDQDSVGGGFDTGQAFAGQLDDAAIYPTALGANRIQAHHRAGFAPGCATASAVSRFLAPSERVPDPR